MNKTDLKPCPFCGKENVYSEFLAGIGRKRYEIRTGCRECKYYLTTDYISKNEFISLEETIEFAEQAAEKWNTRSGKI